MMSSSVAVMRRTNSEASGLPLMMTGLPSSRGSYAKSSRSKRRGCFFGFREAESGPWQRKQCSERMGPMTLLYEIALVLALAEGTRATAAAIEANNDLTTTLAKDVKRKGIIHLGIGKERGKSEKRWEKVRKIVQMWKSLNIWA